MGWYSHVNVDTQKVCFLSNLLPVKGCTNHDKVSRRDGQCRAMKLGNVGLCVLKVTFTATVCWGLRKPPRVLASLAGRVIGVHEDVVSRQRQAEKSV